MKKLVRALVLVMVVLVLLLGGALGLAFLGNAPVVDGKAFADGRVLTVSDGYVSCYLVRSSSGAKRWLLIDACADVEAKAIAAALSQHGSSLDDVGLVLLTHGHVDHTGGLPALKRAEVRALAAEQPLLSGAAPPSPIGRIAGGNDSGVRLARPLDDGERLGFEGTDIEVFATPGHTAGSAVYLAHGVLFFGDNASLSDEGALKGAPWIFSDDTAENGRSLIALYNRLSRRAGDVKHMTFGHTGAADGIAALKAFTP